MMPRKRMENLLSGFDLHGRSGLHFSGSMGMQSLRWHFWEILWILFADILFICKQLPVENIKLTQLSG